MIWCDVAQVDGEEKIWRDGMDGMIQHANVNKHEYDFCDNYDLTCLKLQNYVEIIL